MSVRHLLFALLACWLSFACQSENNPPIQEKLQPQICIYGATPAGIAAAIASAKSDKKVLLIEPTSRIGGMLTNGLSHSDFYTFEALTGTFLEFSNRVEQFYIDEYGEDSEQAKMSFRGVFGEPKVNLAILQQMLAEQSNVSTLKNTVIDSVFRVDNHLEEATFSRNGTTIRVAADLFIDGSYEGDLMALAGVPYAVGREGKEVYGESLAPDQSDNQLQGYNFRFCATNVAENRAEVIAPKGYNRADFANLIPILDSVEIDHIFSDPSRCIYKAHQTPLPNYKYDINDVSRGAVRLSLPGLNLAWPEGDQATRQQIFDRHLYHNIGILYFLQNDPAVPEKYRQQALEWGWCKDEFIENKHLPVQLYVREARRMIGRYIYKEQDSEHQGEDARAILHKDAIAIGDYSNNCHGTFHEGPLIGGYHTGEFYKPIPPYQIPYGVLIPQKVDNLIVPAAMSASHVGFCALRLEPIWMSLGQASGHAAALAIDHQLTVQNITVAELQQRLYKDRLATIYVSDLSPEHEDFAAVQWWGTHGGFHGLHSKIGNGQRGKMIFGQFSQAAVGHAVELEATLSEPVKQQWLTLAQSLNLDIASLQQASTRGAFIRAAYDLSGAAERK